MYATAADLVRRYPASDLARLTNEADVAVPPALLGTLAAGGDPAGEGYTIEELAAAKTCLRAIEQALFDAQAEVDPYLASAGYDVPFGGEDGSGAPAALERVAAQVAYYHLHARPNDYARQRYEDAVQFLNRIARGRASLGPTEGGEDGPAPPSGVDYTGSDPVFSSGGRPGRPSRW